MEKLSRVTFYEIFILEILQAVFYHNFCDKKVTRSIFRGSTGFFLDFATGSFVYHLLNFAKLSRASSRVIFDPKVLRVSRSVMGISLENLHGLLYKYHEKKKRTHIYTYFESVSASDSY